MIICSVMLFTVSLQSLWAQPAGAPANQITVSLDELPDFREVYVNTVSEVQFYDVYVYPASTELLIEAEPPFKVSLSCNDGFETSITLTPTAGTIDERVYVRAFPESVGDYSPMISHTSTSAGTADLQGSITVITTGIPGGYYTTATATGSELKTQLHHIIKGHNELSYGSLWYHMQTTDVTFGGYVWDIYSDIPCSEPPYLFVFEDDQDSGSGGNQEGDVYNREHSMPKSWFGGSVSPMNTDLYHIYPTDKRVNAVRGSYPFGEVENPQWTSLNGSRLGPNTAGSNYSGIAFEPIDAYKGDLARSYFYMITRYEDRIEDWTYNDLGNAMFDHNTYPGFQQWAVDMLMEWHRNDPVSHREHLRNDAIYQVQGNRNPFIDHPEFAERIWGDTTAVSVSHPYVQQVVIYPNPANNSLSFQAPFNVESIEVYDMQGKRIVVFKPSQSTGQADVSMLTPGIYTLRFLGDNIHMSKRLQIY